MTDPLFQDPKTGVFKLALFRDERLMLLSRILRPVWALLLIALVALAPILHNSQLTSLLFLAVFFGVLLLCALPARAHQARDLASYIASVKYERYLRVTDREQLNAAVAFEGFNEEARQFVLEFLKQNAADAPALVPED